ncbi:uncharacterized protein L201_003913 [Kwoniella dendrophila CBS 6074]|uniref:Uncharacterized protein n=1 Tax=Kwoniella dendrophila CBS 6074 TaxID=1295534 RepID=A0AAX4JU86_9TREE
MSKLQQQWEVEERKLQSVYDDISSNRLSSASSTLNRYLKKNTKSQPGLILKMYINQKTNVNSTDQELLDLFDKQIKPLGEMTGRGIWWIGLVFRNMGRTDLALQLYQDLSEKHPDSPQIIEQVFLHAAADDNVESSVKSSKKLYNLTRDEKWARLSAWSEWVKNAPQPTPTQPFPPPASSPISLKIATLLMNTSKSPLTSETLWLKLQILLSANQLEEALSLLQGKEGIQGGLVRLWWRMEGVKEILKRSHNDSKDTKKHWEKERDWIATLLKDDKDSQRNYSYYRHLLICTENLISNPEIVKSTYDLIHNLEVEIGSKERSPLLAKLELQLILRKNKMIKSDIILENDKWIKEVEKYWISWGSKGSIITEIEGLVEKDDEERRDLVRRFLEKQASQQHSDEQSFREQVNAQIYLLRDKPSGWKPTLEEVKEYWELYLSGLQYGKNLPKTDIRPTDQIGLTTVNLLIELWSNDKANYDILSKAIICLEKIVKDSPACAHAHYLLIRLYRLIGAPSLVSSHLSTLKLSEIQLDNLLHVFSERGSAESLLGNNQETWNDHLKKSGDMYQRTAIDFPEYIKDSLSNETYSKITSIRYLHSSITKKSISNHLRTIEQARLATYISAPYGTKLLQKLDSAATENDLTDLRNHELINEIGGNRPLIRDLTNLDPKVGQSWIKAFSGLYKDLGKFVNSGDGFELEFNELQIPQELLPFENALIRHAGSLIRTASKAISSTEASIEYDFTSLFDENIQLALSAELRWEQIQSMVCLYEFIKITDVILSKTAEYNKKLKGKKKSSVLSQFVTDLRIVQETLIKEGLKPVIEKIDRINEIDIDWDKVNAAWVQDEDLIDDITKSIDQSRKNTITNIKSFLLDGKLPDTKKINANGKKK